MLQMAIFSQLTLVNGTADLILLIVLAWSLQEKSSNGWFWGLVGGALVSLVSAVPVFGTPMLVYVPAAMFSHAFLRRTGEVPLLGMLLATVIFTLYQHGFDVVILFVAGTSIPVTQAIALVALPSLLLNLLFALPIYAMMRDLAQRVYPGEAI